MRESARWALEQLNGDEAVLDVGGMEGGEVAAFLENADSVSVVNFRGKTPIDGAAYFPAGNVGALPAESGEYDVVVSVNFIGFLGMGAYGLTEQNALGRLASEMRRVLQPGGLVLVSGPVGRPEISRIRQGAIHVYHRDEIVEAFAGFELVDEAYIVDGNVSGWPWGRLKLWLQSAVENKALRSEGCYVFAKANDEGHEGQEQEQEQPPDESEEVSAEDGQDEPLAAGGSVFDPAEAEVEAEA